MTENPIPAVSPRDYSESANHARTVQRYYRDAQAEAGRGNIMDAERAISAAQAFAVNARLAAEAEGTDKATGNAANALEYARRARALIFGRKPGRPIR